MQHRHIHRKLVVITLFFLSACAEQTVDPAIIPNTSINRPAFAIALPSLPDLAKDPLQVRLVNNSSAQGSFLPSDSLVLEFTVPMELDFLDDAMRIFPAVEGKFSWSGSEDRLAFIPTDGFTPGENYTLTVTKMMVSASGQSFERDVHFRFQVEDFPRVIRRDPLGPTLLDRTPRISLTFNKAIDMQSFASALEVNPAIKYAIEREADNKYAIIFRQPLAMETRYRVSLRGDAADAFGLKMDKEYEWDYWLARLKVDVTGPMMGQNSRPLLLNFNYAIDPQRFEESLQTQPSISAEFLWEQDLKSVSLVPMEPLLSDTTYEFQFENLLVDTHGNPLATPSSFTFRTPPPILSTYPAQDEESVSANQIQIDFDRPMNQRSVETAFDIHPAVPGYFSWDESRMIFHLENVLSGYTTFNVSLDPSALDASGRRILKDPFIWTFRTASYIRQASFGESGSKIQIVDAEGLRAVQFGLGNSNPTRIFFELYELSMRQLVDMSVKDASFKSPNIYAFDEELELAHRWEITSGLEGEHWNIKQVFLPKDVSPGIYHMNMTINGQLQDQMVVILTHNTLAVKKTGHQLVVWASDIHGDVSPRVEIRVYSTSGSQIREQQTDENGMYRTVLNTGEHPLIVLARNKKGDITAAGLNDSWQATNPNAYWWQWWRRPAPINSYRAYIYTDRPIYRPGQTVSFKAILRNEDDVRYSLLPAGTPVEVRIRDSRDNVVQTFQLNTNEFGSFHGEFNIAKAAMLGEYAVEVRYERESHLGHFKVEDYRKPDVQVVINSGETNYVEGDTINISVDAHYLFGEPVDGAKLTIRQYRLGEFYGNWWDEEPADAVEYVWYSSGREPIHGRLDSQGKFSTAIEAVMLTDSYYSMYWRSNFDTSSIGIEVTIDDGSHQSASNFTVVKVSNASEKIDVERGSYNHPPGSVVDVQIAVETINNEPVAGRDLQIELLRWERISHDYVEVGNAFHVVTDESGLAMLPLILKETGNYKLLVSGMDDRGNEISYVSHLAAYDTKRRRANFDLEQDLSISADRDTYSPYQTAKLYIESSFSGPALLTIERGKVIREMLIELTPPITIFDLTLHEIDAPNIFVTVNAWKAQSTFPAEFEYQNMPESRLLVASLELTVEPINKELIVTLIADQDMYQPGEEATVEVLVTNETGQPVSAEISLAMVDEAIFSLSEELSINIVDFFYGRRENDVNTYGSMSPRRWIWSPGMGGGGGDGSGFPSSLRSDFLDTAAWFPNLHTNSSGKAMVTFVLPDNLTSWRISAIAITKSTKVGEGSINIITHKDLVVRPIIPRHLTAGDSAMLTAFVHNYTESGQFINVSIASAELEVFGPSIQRIFVMPGESKVVGWRVTASDAQQATMLISAIADEYADAVELQFPITPLAIVDGFTSVGRIDEQLNTDFILPPEALDSSFINIELSRSIDGNLLSGLEYLTGFPYGCVEQIMSKALPNAVVGRAMLQLGESYAPLHVDLSEKINAGLQMLYAKQHNGGGWGWWYDDASHDYQTAWVVFGLALTMEAGYEVDPDVITQGVEWLRANLEQMDPRTRAYALLSMAMAGEGNLEATRSLAEEWYGLDSFSQSALALTLFELGDLAGAEFLVQVLADSATIQDSHVYWKTSQRDGYYNRKTMASSTRSTALALSAFMHIQPEHEHVPGMVRWLMSQRKGRGWGTTNETSFAILGLTDFLLATQASAEDSNFVVELNGKEIVRGTLTPTNPLQIVFLERSQMLEGSNELTITREGEGQLFYVINAKMLIPQDEIQAEGSIIIARSYFDARSNQPVEDVRAGELIKVNLYVQMPAAGSYMLVEDKLPGGLEAVNAGFNSSNHIADEYGEQSYSWEGLGYNYKEIFGNRVSFFITEMKEGQHTFSYYARATQTGDFTAMPAEAWAMYDLSFRGISASSQFSVVDEQFVDQSSFMERLESMLGEDG